MANTFIAGICPSANQTDLSSSTGLPTWMKTGQSLFQVRKEEREYSRKTLSQLLEDSYLLRAIKVLRFMNLGTAHQHTCALYHLI